MSSYVYRERDRERDREEPHSSVSIKRYVIPRENSSDREIVYRHEDSATGDRELVIRHSSDREDEPVVVRRYEHDEVDYYDPPPRYDREYRSDRDYHEREYYQSYALRRPRSAIYISRPDQPVIVRDGQSVIIQEARGPVYVNPRESDYEIVRRSEADPRDDEYYYRRRIRDRELSPRDSVSQVSSRHREDHGYSSDDSMVYIRKETREYDDSPHRGRHLMSGALIGIGAAELLRNHRKKEGDEVSHGLGRFGRDIGAGALGAVAANVIERHRSKSRHRSHSFDDDRTYYRRHRSHSHSHSRDRSHSGSRAKTMTEIGLGAAAIAGALALSQKKKKKKSHSRRHSSRSRSRRRHSRHHRSSSSDHSSRHKDDARSQSHRRKRIAEAGLAGAVVAGLVEKARSRSRSRHGHRSRSRSTVRKALPIILAGAGTAAATAFYEKNKAKKLEDEEEEEEHRGRRRSKSKSKSRSQSRPRSLYDLESPHEDPAGLIEYGERPVSGRIPAADYFGRPPSSHGHYSDSAIPLSPGYRASRPRRRSRSRARSRYSRSPSSDSDDYRRRSSRHRKHGKRDGSRARDLAEAAVAAAGIGYAAHEYVGHRDRKKAEKERRGGLLHGS